MFKTFRHTLFLLPVMWLLTACDSQEPKSDTPGAAMEFDIAGLTRTSCTTSQNIGQNSFAVYGDMTFTVNQSNTVIFNGVPVSYTGVDNKWTYSDTQYWFPGHEHSFVALHPANAASLSDITYSKNKLKFTYTQPSNYLDAVDLLTSVHRRLYGEGASDAVRFTFAHILSDISVNVTVMDPELDGTNIVINGITFNDVPVEATYSVLPAPLTGNSSMTYDRLYPEGSIGGWEIEKRGNFNIDFSRTASGLRDIPADRAPHELFSDTDALLLLPNPSASTEMVLSYTTFDSPDGERNEKTATVIIPKGWSPGKTLVLSLIILKDAVKFNIDVAEWKEGTSTSTTVPRK